MAGSYSLVLSKGTHLVDGAARSRVLAAIEAGEPVVEIALDRFHDGTTTHATIVTAHVVAVFPNEDADLPSLPANVTPLVRRS